jgi:hypothetical protein
MRGAFNGCANLTSVPGATEAESPDLNDVTDMTFMFYNATSFNSNISA